jgi:hypothetical protein
MISSVDGRLRSAIPGPAARCPNSRLETNMTYAKKTLFVLLLAASLAAAAQDAHTKFTLPCNANWGKTSLPAGTYSVSLEFGGISKAYVTSADNPKLAFVVVPATAGISDACRKSSVTLHRDGSEWSVRSVCFGELQMALYFLPEPARTSMAALPANSQAVIPGR